MFGEGKELGKAENGVSTLYQFFDADKVEVIEMAAADVPGVEIVEWPHDSSEHYESFAGLMKRVQPPLATGQKLTSEEVANLAERAGRVPYSIRFQVTEGYDARHSFWAKYFDLIESRSLGSTQS